MKSLTDLVSLNELMGVDVESEFIAQIQQSFLTNLWQKMSCLTEQWLRILSYRLAKVILH